MLKSKFIAAAFILTASVALLGVQGAALAAAQAFSVQATPIGVILKSDAAKAVIDKELPGLKPFYGAIGSMTLAQIAKSSHGAIGDDKLKLIQGRFDTLP